MFFYNADDERRIRQHNQNLHKTNFLEFDVLGVTFRLKNQVQRNIDCLNLHNLNVNFIIELPKMIRLLQSSSLFI